MLAKRCSERLGLRLPSISAPLLLALAILAFSWLGSPAYSAEYKPFELNTVSRDMGLSGSLGFTVLNGGSIEYSGGQVSVSPGDLVEIVVSDTDLRAELWVGSDGWVDIEDLDVVEVRVNGVTVITSDEIEAKNIRVDVGGVTSSLEVFVTSSTSGWTSLVFDGTTLINGNDDSDILLSGARPGQGTPLNIDISPSSQYASGKASTAYVNGTEVPEISPLGIVVLALAGLLVVMGRFRSTRNRGPPSPSSSLQEETQGLAGVGRCA